MVKGISKRVIVVKAPIGSIFDEAIFILRENALSPEVDAERILHEACIAADDYVKNNCQVKWRFKLSGLPLLIFLLLFSLAIFLFLLIF